MRRSSLLVSLVLLTAIMCSSLPAQTPTRSSVIFRNVHIFDGQSEELSKRVNVLVEGNQIKSISTSPVDIDGAKVIDADGRVLMPGLIDAHTHIMFATLPQHLVLTADVGFIHIAATKTAREMLMRGFTSIRDMGGPVFGLKRGIDLGLVPGPRIWPAGAFISQTGGHGDFRLPNELPARPGDFTHSERTGAAAIADSPDIVRLRTREQLALGASQIKLMAGGGVASSYDPLDVTQYSVPELRAAVEAAENWGTYVTVHAYTPRAVRQAIQAGVKCIEHGQLLDDSTTELMAKEGIWWSLQPFLDDRPSTFPEGSPNRIKQLQMFEGTNIAFGFARKHKIKTAWGTDILFSAENAAAQGAMLSKMVRWYSPAEVLRMATAGNAELLALSGKRSPYTGELGIIKVGALADLLLIDGNPLKNIELLADPEKNLVVIMKDGIIYKNRLL